MEEKKQRRYAARPWERIEVAPESEPLDEIDVSLLSDDELKTLIYIQEKYDDRRKQKSDDCVGIKDTDI